MFTCRSRSSQSTCIQFSCAYRPCGVEGSSIKSSANKRINNTLSPGSSCIPCFHQSATPEPTLFMILESKVGQRTHLCLNRCEQSNISVNSLLPLTHGKTFMMVAFKTLINIPALSGKVSVMFLLAKSKGFLFRIYESDMQLASSFSINIFE